MPSSVASGTHCIIEKVYRSSSIFYSCPILMKREFSRQIFEKNSQISIFMKVLPMGAQLLVADGRTDRHYEVNSRFSEFCERA